MLAIEKAEELGTPPERIFVGQFSLSKNVDPPIPGYLSQPIADHYLHYCPSLDLLTLTDKTGAKRGCVLGIALDAKGEHLAGQVEITGQEGQSVPDALEEMISTWTGRYAVFMDTRSDLRIYTDAVGEMGVVFDTRTGIVGSTLPVVLNRAIEERPDLSNEAIMASRGHYALGYTRDLFCERLFPNHRLSLKTLEQSRFWPRDDAELTEAMQMSEDDITDELIGILRRNTLGFMLAKASVFPLSGGQDSRILISSARDHLDMSSIIFGMHHNWASGQDCDIGAQVAARLGLNYWRITAPKLKRWGQRAFDARVGWATVSGGKRSLRHTQRLPDGHLVIRGNVMGLTRASDWGREGKAKAWDNARFGKKRLLLGDAINDGSVPVDMDSRYASWRDSLPGDVKLRAHDFSFCENYLPNSLGARNYAYVNVTHVNPFASRRAIMITSSLAPDIRREGAINRAILEKIAPDLRDIPLI